MLITITVYIRSVVYLILLLEWAAYSKLWHETAAVEKIKRSVDDILREETGMAQRTRKHEHDLS